MDFCEAGCSGPQSDNSVLLNTKEHIVTIDWWDIPCYSRMPEPLFSVEISDYQIPIIRLPETCFEEQLRGLNIAFYAFLGFMACPGSIKRIPAEFMIDKSVETGRLKPGGKLVEPTSGNMGTAMAYYAKKKYGVEFTAVVSSRVPDGKLLPIRRQGASVAKESELVQRFGLTDKPSSITLAQMLAEDTDAVFLNQYGCEWNWMSYLDPAEQVIERLRGNISLYVSAVGSTGTLIGFGTCFKKYNPDLRIVATMPYLGQDIEGTRDPLRLMEITHEWRKIITVEDPTDYRVARAVSGTLNEHNIPVGRSAGAALAAAEHDLLTKKAGGTLDELRCSDGTIGVFLPFADTVYPYA